MSKEKADGYKSKHNCSQMKRDGERTDDLLLGAQHPQLAEADVKGRTLEGSVRLSHHNDIDPPGESGGVEATVKLLHCHKNSLRELAHNIHGLGLETKQQQKAVRRSRVSMTEEAEVSAFSVFFCQQFLTPPSIHSSYRSRYQRIITTNQPK